MPAETDSINVLVNYGRYAISRVRADPGVKALSGVLATPHTALLKQIGARNQAADALIDCEANRDFAFAQFGEVVLDLGRQAYAHFGSRKADAYLRLFPEAPSALAELPIKDRAVKLGALVKEFKAAETPKAFAPTVKVLGEWWEKLQAGQGAVDAAAGALDKERKAEGVARKGWFDGYKRLHAQLTDKYPSEKKRVDGYFRSAGGKKKAVATPAQNGQAAAKAGASA